MRENRYLVDHLAFISVGAGSVGLNANYRGVGSGGRGAGRGAEQRRSYMNGGERWERESVVRHLTEFIGSLHVLHPIREIRRATRREY